LLTNWIDSFLFFLLLLFFFFLSFPYRNNICKYRLVHSTRSFCFLQYFFNLHLYIILDHICRTFIISTKILFSSHSLYYIELVMSCIKLIPLRPMYITFMLLFLYDRLWRVLSSMHIDLSCFLSMMSLLFWSKLRLVNVHVTSHPIDIINESDQ
jgi:hypothetical protein